MPSGGGGVHPIGRRQQTEVILVERAGHKDPLDVGQSAIVNRGKRSLAVDLKDGTQRTRSYAWLKAPMR